MFASILMVVNGTFDGVSQQAISPGSEPSPVWRESTIQSLFTVGFGQKKKKNETTKLNEREIRLKFRSHGHTHALMVHTVVRKRTYPD